MRCEPAHHFTVAKAWAWRSSIDDDPPYQRPGDVWSLDRRQLFIDSLLNGYDVPKFYLHDLWGHHPTKVYAVVDGFPLAPRFRVEPGNLPILPPGAVTPTGALHFSGLDAGWRAVVLSTFLSVVLIRDASVDDIEELFLRLNNGVPLTPGRLRCCRAYGSTGDAP